MTILAVDQGYDFCSIAVKRDNGEIFSKILNFETNRLTSSLTRDFMGELMALSGHLESIKTIAATVGPSSFTGLRVVLAALQGVAFGTQAKIFTCTRLELQAFQAFQKKPSLHEYQSYLSNQRGQFFTQTFHNIDNLPIAFDEVSLTDTSKCAEEDNDTARSLLNWIHLLGSSTFGSYRDLRPFYGHDPVFKKKSLQ